MCPKIIILYVVAEHLFSTILCGKEDRRYMQNSKETSKKAASAASKALRDGRTSSASKTAAGSALSQRPSKKTK